MTFDVLIEKIVEGGLGLAHHDNRAILLPLTAPGDRVRCEMTRRAGRRHEARLIEILEPAPSRVEPSCRHYGECGGCHLQHLRADAQLAGKREVARETLARLGGIEPPDPLRIEPSPQPLGYRHRATLHVDWRAGAPRAGFFRARSHDTIEIDRCPLLSDAGNDALRFLLDACLPALRASRPARAELAATDDGRFEIALADERPLDPNDAATLREIAEAQEDLHALYERTGPGSYRALHVRSDPLTYTVPAADGSELALSFDLRVFTQANLNANRALVGALIDATADLAGGVLLDLYAGNGNLSLPLWPRLRATHLIDLNPIGLQHAERAVASLPRPPELALSAGPAAETLARLAPSGARPDLVLLDPPRQGAAELLSTLSRIDAPRILYVSCSVPSLARDIASLRRHGYRLDSLRLFDLYPQTAHVEALAELSR